MGEDEIETIAVLGAGTMGHGIAEVAAIAGYDVWLRDISEDIVADGIAEIEWSLEKLAEHGQLSESEADGARDRITGVVDVAEAVAGADIVIEAVPERMEIKRDVFSEVSEAAPDDCLFATNTSSLSVSEIAAVTDRPERVCGMHFFNPPVRMDLVEVIAGEETSEETLERVEALAESMDKTPVRVEIDRPGFIVNRILTPFLNESAWLVHSDAATIETVDATTKYELGLPMGAFELADRVGIDVCYHVLSYIHEELGAAYEPCPLLAAKVEADELGQKSDVGFYDYANGGVSIPSDAGSADLAERLLAILANEVAKVLEEGVADVDAVDTAMELGTGFPDGPAVLADDYGLEKLQERLDALAADDGHPRYAVADSFSELIDRGGFRPTDEDTADSGFSDLRIEYPADNVATVVIDRSHRMNAISPNVLEELPQAIERLESEADVRAVLIRGAGDRAFSVGADIQAMSAVWGDGRGAMELSRTGQEAFGTLEESDLPVIAAIDGYCLGGGMELATAADIRIATEGSTFGQPERDLGLLPAWGGTQRLAPIVGEGVALEIVLTGDRYEAEEMASYGFINRLIGVDEFPAAAIEFASEIAAGPPIAQGYTKRAMYRGRVDRTAGLEIEAQAFGHLTDTDDLAEGISAFLEDRDPKFTGS